MKTRSSLFICSLIFVSGILLISPLSANAAPLTSVTVAPVTNNADNLMGQTSATWRFTIDNVTALATSSDAVEITFPSVPTGNWNFQSVTASTTALGGDLLNFATTTLYIDNGTRKIILAATSTQTSADNNFIIDIKGVGNPMGDYSAMGNYSWSVRTCTLNAVGDASSGCASDIDSAATGSASLTRRGGFIDDWSFTASNYSASANGVTYTITFTASTTLSTGEKIYVNFPVGFTITAATATDQTIVSGGTAQIASTTVATTTSYGFNAVILSLSAGTVDPSATSTVSFTIGNITNPAKGSYQGFRIFTTTANSGLVDGLFFGMEVRNDMRPPPMEGIQIGGTNTVIGQVKIRQTNGTLRDLTANEASQIRVGMGCPDLMFFAGVKRLSLSGSIYGFTYNNLLDATYMMGVMPDNTTDKDFFDSYLQPNMTMINLTGSETATVTPTFEIPDGVIQGSITGGPASASGVFIRAYTSSSESYSPFFTTTSYATEGLNASGVGYFELPVKTGQTWNFSIMTDSTLTSGGAQYWTPAVDPIYIDPGTATTTASAFSFVVADKTLNVTLRSGADNSVIDETVEPHPCVSVRRAGTEMMGPGGQGVCSTTLVNGIKVYQLKVPTGAFAVQIMMPGGFKEYPVTVASTDTTVNQTIVIERPTSYISGTVTDPDTFPIQGVTIMAQGSNGTFSQTLTDSSGAYTLYVPPGIYRVEAFAPSYGPLTPKTGVTVNEGSNATGQNFTITAASFKKITGRVYTDTNTNNQWDSGETTYADVHIRAYGTAGSNFAMSRGDGTYTLRVPAGTGYTIEAWSKDMGMVGSALTNVDVSNDVADKDFKPAALGYLQITVADGNTNGLTELFSWAFNPSTGKGNGSDQWTATSTTDLVTKFSLPAGTYRLDVGIPIFGNLTDLAANIDATTTTITAGNTSSLTITLPTMATLSGNTTANATVWSSRTDGPGKFSTTADSSGAYSMKLPTGYTYMVGSSLPGYVNTPVTVSFTGATTQDLTLTASAYTITGTVSSSAGGTLTEGFVWATKANNSGWTGSEISGNGSYTLNVDSGTWTVYANGPCYNPSSGISQTGSGTVNITLTPISGCSFRPPEIKSIVPSSGGTVATSSVSVNIPPNALGTGSSNVSFSVSTPTNIPPSTLNAAPITDSIRSIVASDSNGTTITNLNNSIEITVNYDEADIPAGSSEDNLQLAYWNTTTNTWDAVAATVDTDNNTITSRVSHLTDFAPIVPTSENAPSSPTGLSATVNGDTQIDLGWTAVSGATSYLVYRDTSVGGSFPYLATASTNSYSSAGLTGSTAYYYRVSASNANGESAATTTVSATTCASVNGGTVSGASCTLTCNSGYRESNGSCILIGGGGIIGGGGGGGGANVPTPQYVVIPGTATTAAAELSVSPSTPQASKVAQPSPVAQLVSPVFNRTLRYGITSDEVKRLQELFVSDPEIYPEGIVSGWFGQLTRKAVQKFQCKYNIVCEGNENTTGYGLLGPKTRAKIKEVFGSKVEVPSEQATQIEQIQAKIQELLEKIKTLQEQLKLLQQ
ncbi:MAG: carboxypeptidase regulatory-like domain-containing protein [Patescibacteria group bacterium]